MKFDLFDEAYLFDVIAIAYIKLQKNRHMQNLANYERHFHIMEDQIGREKMDLIIHSDEYKNMIEANQSLFDGFDKIKTEEGKNIKAMELDILNYNRHLAKIKLQNKFFPENPLTEVKLGYDKKDV